MEKEPNFLLEYSIDSLLKTFNPDRKPIMKQSHFYKLMNLLDTRLKKQGIDIKLPGYWYRYGFYSEYRFFDNVLPRKFSTDYILDDNIVPPIHTRKRYEIPKEISQTISSTIYYLWNQYGFKSNYGAKAKKESYKINSPYTFNTTFQDYIEIIDSKEVNLFVCEKILDKLLLEFPDDEFSELSDTYFDWDDTTRLILDSEINETQIQLIEILMNLFWKIYSKGVRWRHNQNISIDDIQKWKQNYFYAIPNANKEIEEIRRSVLLEYYEPSSKDVGLVKELMEKAYEMSLGV